MKQQRKYGDGGQLMSLSAFLFLHPTMPLRIARIIQKMCRKKQFSKRLNKMCNTKNKNILNIRLCLDSSPGGY